MTTIILNQQNAAIPLGLVLSSATDKEIQINDESGRPVARILLEAERPGAPRKLTDAELTQLRRRRQSSREFDISTKELLARAHARAQAHEQE